MYMIVIYSFIYSSAREEAGGAGAYIHKHLPNVQVGTYSTVLIGRKCGCKDVPYIPHNDVGFPRFSLKIVLYSGGT